MDTGGKKGMTAGKLWMLLAVVVVLAASVKAEEVRVLMADGCGWTDGTQLTCSNVKYIACNVSDTNGGTVRATGLDFKVNGRWYAASLYSGNATEGVWRATVDKTYGESMMEIEQVIVRNSIGWQCSFAPTVTNPLYQSGDPYSCFISFQGRGFTPDTCGGSPSVCTSYQNASACSAVGCNWTVSYSNDTGMKGATAYSGVGWANPQNAFTMTNDSTTSANTVKTNTFSGFNLTLPANSVVTGIGVTVNSRASSTTGTQRVSVKLSNGTHYSTQLYTPDMPTSFRLYGFGGSSDVWGLSWANGTSGLKIDVISNPSSTSYTVFLDYVGITVYYYVSDRCLGTPNACSVYTTNSTCGAAGCTYYQSVGSTIAVEADCPCEITTTTVKIPGSPNQCTTTWIPSAGCEEGTVTTATGYCDWCDPDWQVSYGQCVVDRNADDPFRGLAIKHYEAGNASCCESTNLDEDCNPPADADQKVVCIQDYYATGGGDSLTSSHGQRENSLNEPMVYSANVYAELTWKPLVFDIENDGTTEMMVFEDIAGVGRIKLFKDYMLEDYYEVYPLEISDEPLQIVGQPSLFGFSAWAPMKYAWNADVKSKAVGVGVASVVLDQGTGTYKFVSWRRESGVFIQKHVDALGVSSPGAGVNCYVDECFFMEADGTVVRVNALNQAGEYGTVKSTRSVGQSSGSTFMDSLPAILHFDSSGPAAFAVEGAMGGSAALFVCPMNLSSSISCDYVSVGVPIGRMSKIAATEPSNGIVKMYFTGNNGSVSRLWTVTVNMTNTTMDVLTTNSVTLSSLGGTSSCVSDPALATCYNGQEGVAVVSHWRDTSGYNEYACYGGGVSKISGWTQREEYCPKAIATQELSWSSASSIISPSGIFSYNQRVASFTGAENQSTVIVADLTSSTYTGITTVSRTILKNIVSTVPKEQVTTTDELSIGNVGCAFDPIKGTISATAFGVTAPDKENIEFRGSYVSDIGLTATDVASTSPKREFVVSRSGTYTITVILKDVVTGDTVQGSCDVGATVTEAPSVASMCEVGENNVEGSFNYVGTVQEHGWLLSSLSEPRLMNTSFLTFLQSPGYTGNIYYPLACLDQRIRVESRLRASSSDEDAGTSSQLVILAKSSANTGATIVPIASVSIVRNEVEPRVIVIATSAENNTFVYVSNGTNTSSSVKWLTIGITVDRLLGQYFVDVTEDGGLPGQVYSTGLTNYVTGSFAGVMIGGANGLYVDYISVVNQSGIVIQEITQEQKLKQQAANTYLRRCQNGTSEYTYNRSQRMSFANVKAYCDRISNVAEHLDNPGYCTFKDLQEVVMANANCYAEAYAYCVNVTYMKTAGFSDSGIESLTKVEENMESLEMESTGADGAGVCAATLGISVVASKQALPFMNVLWGLMADYWVYLLVFMVIVVIIGGMQGPGGE